MKKFIYEIKSSRETTIRELQQKLLVIINELSSPSTSSTVQILSGLNAVILTTTDGKLIDKLMGNKEFQLINIK